MSGADPGFCIRKSNAEGVRPSRGVRHAPPENFEMLDPRNAVYSVFEVRFCRIPKVIKYIKRAIF